MEYCVYKHTSPDGRVYIGITSQKPEARWQNGNGYKGNTYFTRSIKKHGWENFKHEILYIGLSVEDAKQIEINLIATYQSNKRKFGYNISSGGESSAGRHISEKQKRIISEANKGKIVSAETRARLSMASRKTWSNPEFVQHMREINTGEKNPVYGRRMTDADKIKRKAKSVIQYNKDGTFAAEYISIHEANSKTGVHRGDIAKCCEGIYKQAGGYVWKYKAKINGE